MTRIEEGQEHALETGRSLYEDTSIPVSEIAQLLNMSVSTFRRHAKRAGWERRGLSKDKARNNEQGRDQLVVLAGRLRATIAREIAATERIRKQPDESEAQLASCERMARLLASLTKTLNELRRLEAVAAPPVASAPHDDIDIEEFKRDLARKLEALYVEDESCGDHSSAQP